MKSILLYANDDEGMEQRLDAALCLSSQFDCLVICVQVTPYDAFIMGDPFGGIYALPTVVQHIEEAETTHRLRIEDRLKRQRVRWEWQNYEGNPGQVLVERSRLTDLAIVSMPGKKTNQAASLAVGLALHSRAPVLAMPAGDRSFTCNGDVLIAWDDSPEAAYALRCAVPLLKNASQVHVVTVARRENVPPQTEVIHYLLQHGVQAQIHDPLPAGTSIAATLLQTAKKLGAHFIVAGATGHWHLRKAVVGDVTAELIASSEIPLLIAH